MVGRPFVLASVAMSVDGYIDDTSDERLRLSNDEDFDRVDEVRADMDAILIGAGTIRADNPRLIIRSAARRAARVAAGKPEHLLKATITERGSVDPGHRFWHHGGEKVVYTTDAGRSRIGDGLAGLADVVPLGDRIDIGSLLDDLGNRGVEKLMVEGGTRVHTAFMSAGLVDELHLAVAPLVVGDDNAPRFLDSASYLQRSTDRMRLVEVRRVGDVVLARYHPKILNQ